MEIKEFGFGNKRIALLIHGGYVSWKTLNTQILELQKDYHVFVPILDGHNLDDDSELISIEQEAAQILSYFENQNILHIDVMYGASLGADIVLEILFQNGNFSKYAFIESGSLGINKLLAIPLVFITKTAMYKGVRGSKRWEKFIDNFLEGIKMPEELYQDTKDILKHMSKRTIENVQKLVCNYKLKASAKDIATKCLVVYTSKEKSYMEKPYKKLASMNRNFSIKCLDGYNHGQLCIGEPCRQLEMLKEFIN